MWPTAVSSAGLGFSSAFGAFGRRAFSASRHEALVPPPQKPPAILSCSGASQMAHQVAALLNTSVSRCSVATDPEDGETKIRFIDRLVGRDVLVFQSTCDPRRGGKANDGLLEAILLGAAARREGARKLAFVLPYLSYVHGRQPEVSANVARLLGTVRPDSVVTIDLPNSESKGLFNEPRTPCVMVSSLPAVRTHLLLSGLHCPSLLSANPETSLRASLLWRELKRNIPHITLNHFTDEGGVKILGDVQERDCVVLETVLGQHVERSVRIARSLRAAGAKRVILSATHPLLDPSAAQALEASDFDEIVSTDTIETEPGLLSGKLTILTVAPLVAAAVRQLLKTDRQRPFDEWG